MRFCVLVGDAIWKGARLCPDISSRGERDIPLPDIESYIGLSSQRAQKMPQIVPNTFRAESYWTTRRP